MFCPNCGSESGPSQRFCRTCGLRLDVITDVVHQELQESKVEPIRSSWLRTIFLTAWHYGLFLLLLGMVITGIGKKIVGEQLIADIGTVMSLVGMGFLVARGMLLLKGTAHSVLHERQSADTTTELRPQLEAKDQASVSEFTTRHFEPVHAERKDPD